MRGAAVRIEGTGSGTATDSLGRYRLPGVPAGPQTLRVSRIGYATVRVPLAVPARGTLTRDVQLSERALEMRGLNVTVDAVSRARDELATASVIDLEAIRHQTATSLAGILELVPGVEMEPPGLDGTQQLPLRSAPTSGQSVGSGGIGATALAAFGTLVIVDGIPLSNNANLQTLGPRGELSVPSTAGGGVDLRRIPANTLERVEVIRGLPSVRYGDLTQGAVIVDTRAGEVPPEVAAQFDARTLEGSAIWGRSFGGAGHQGTLTFDVARTAVRPGVAEDDAYRLAAQLSHRAALGEADRAEVGADTPDPEGEAPADSAGASGRSRLVLDTRLDLWQLYDDRPANPNIRIGRSTRKRDWGLRFSERARLTLGDRSRLLGTVSLALTEQDARTRADRVRGAMPFTERLIEGREEGFFVLGRYEADVDVDGGPRLAFGRFELEAEREALGLQHRLRLGLEPRREWNAGRGIQFDVARPPAVTFTGVQGFDRPRTFDEVGALVTTGLYAGDRVRAVLGDEVLLQAQGGVRVDLLHEGGSWFSAVRDAVVQPRLNVELSPVPWLRLRAGAGRVAKSPTLLQLYPAPQYYDVVNVNQFTEDPAERLAVLTTFIEDPANPDLGFIRATKAEAGVEVAVGEGAVSLVAFRDRIEDAVAVRPEPSFLLRDRFALTDSIIGNGVKPQIVTPPIGSDTVPILIDRPDNVVEQTNRGLELVASLPEWERIHTRLQVTGSLVETEQRRDALDFGPRDRFRDFQLLAHDERHPYWEPAVEYGKTALFVYRAIHHQPEAGLVITAALQHNVTDEIEDRAATDTLAFAGYVTRAGELVPVPASERSREEHRDLRVPRGGRLVPRASSPADWFLSVQVSKTLPLDGRLNFWAFNLTDRRGVYTDPDVLPRLYAPMRFGLEVTLPLRSLWGGG